MLRAGRVKTRVDEDLEKQKKMMSQTYYYYYYYPVLIKQISPGLPIKQALLCDSDREEYGFAQQQGAYICSYQP